MWNIREQYFEQKSGPLSLITLSDLRTDGFWKDEDDMEISLPPEILFH